MKIRLFALALACLILIPAVSGCSQPSKPDESATAPQESASGDQGGVASSDKEVSEIMAYVDEIASRVDFKGTTFTWFGPNNVGVNAPEKAEETGDIQSDAVYFRQRDLEDKFGLKWENEFGEHGEDVANRVNNEVMAGGDSYDLVYGSVRSAGTFMLNSGVLQTTGGLEYVDLDQRWWISSLRDTFSIKGNLYFLIGPIVVNSYMDTSLILFNKDVTSMFGMSDEEVYDAVRDGKWTIDRMFEFASKVPENTSGTGVYRYLTPAGFAFVFSSGMTMTHFDEDGVPFIEDTLPKELSDLADKMSAVFGDNSQSAFRDEKKGEDFEDKYGSNVEDMFSDERGLFMFTESDAALYLRKFDISFGILPMPKRTDAQKNYYSYANPWGGSAVYFPKTVKNLTMSDAIAESMAALSQIYVREAYYTKLLKGQAIFDLESLDMLDIIFGSKIYDMADLYAGGNLDNWGEIIKVIDRAIRVDSSTLTSDYKSNAKVVKVNIKQLVKMLDKSN